jgi:small subunit ribosomal protein S8
MQTTNDPISDFLTRVRNAIQARHTSLRMPKSNMLSRIATILDDEGYVDSVEFIEAHPQGEILVHLKYLQDRTNAITTMKRISKPSRRQYVGVREIPRVKNGLGIAILSTSQGVMTGADARQQKLGGEVLCTIW